MHFQPTFLLLGAFLSSAAAWELRYYTGPDCQGAFNAYKDLPSEAVEMCFAASTLEGAGSIGFANISSLSNDVRLQARSGSGGCAAPITFDSIAAGRDFLCATGGPYAGAGSGHPLSGGGASSPCRKRARS